MDNSIIKRNYEETSFSKRLFEGYEKKLSISKTHQNSSRKLNKNSNNIFDTKKSGHANKISAENKTKSQINQSLSLPKINLNKKISPFNLQSFNSSINKSKSEIVDFYDYASKRKLIESLNYSKGSIESHLSTTLQDEKLHFNIILKNLDKNLKIAQNQNKSVDNLERENLQDRFKILSNKKKEVLIFFFIFKENI